MTKPRFMGRFGKDYNPEPKPEIKEEAATEENKQEPTQENPVDKQEPIEKEVEEEGKKPDPVEEENKKPSPEEMEEAKVLEILNKKSGKQFTSLDEYYSQLKTVAPVEKEKPKEEEKPVDKDVEMLSRFKEKFPEKDIDEFIALKKDWKKVDDVTALRQQVCDEYGDDISQNEADLLIKKSLGMDPEDSFDDLSETEKLELKAKARKYKNEKTSSQQEILNSLKAEEKPKEKEPRLESEVIKLPNGQEMPREQYQKLREQYLSENQKVLENTKEYPFQFQFANGEGTETITIPYTLTKQDREQILSATQTIYDPKVAERFTDKEGNFDFNGFQMSKLMELRGQQIMETLLSNAYSQGLEDNVKEEKNIRFTKTDAKPQNNAKQFQVDKTRLPGKNRSFGPRFQLKK